MVRVRRSRPAVRELWARMVMHSLIYWVGWEARTGMTLAQSRRTSDDLWRELTAREAQGEVHAGPAVAPRPVLP